MTEGKISADNKIKALQFHITIKMFLSTEKFCKLNERKKKPRCIRKDDRRDGAP